VIAVAKKAKKRKGKARVALKPAEATAARPADRATQSKPAAKPARQAPDLAQLRKPGVLSL